MFIMTYQIPLPNTDAVSAVRLRAKTKGPLCDNLSGLVFKLFLLDPVLPCYATFYLWKDAEGAVDFLKGPFFAGLVATFGRPEVRLSLPLSLGTRDFPQELWEVQGRCDPEIALCSYHDPRKDEDIALTTISGAGRRFEIMYVARGAAWT